MWCHQAVHDFLVDFEQNQHLEKVFIIAVLETSILPSVKYTA